MGVPDAACVFLSVPVSWAAVYAAVLEIGLEAIRRGEEYAIYHYDNGERDAEE